MRDKIFKEIFIFTLGVGASRDVGDEAGCVPFKSGMLLSIGSSSGGGGSGGGGGHDGDDGGCGSATISGKLGFLVVGLFTVWPENLQQC
jgi:hypothetical protein